MSGSGVAGLTKSIVYNGEAPDINIHIKDVKTILRVYCPGSVLCIGRQCVML